jgi:hypothetical protein
VKRSSFLMSDDSLGSPVREQSSRSPLHTASAVSTSSPGAAVSPVLNLSGEHFSLPSLPKRRKKSKDGGKASRDRSQSTYRATKEFKKYIDEKFEMLQAPPQSPTTRHDIPIGVVLWILVVLLILAEGCLLLYVESQKDVESRCQSLEANSTEHQTKGLFRSDDLLCYLNILWIFGTGLLNPFISNVIRERGWYLSCSQYVLLFTAIISGLLYNQHKLEGSPLASVVLGFYVYLLGWFGNPDMYMEFYFSARSKLGKSTTRINQPKEARDTTATIPVTTAVGSIRNEEKEQ